MHSCGLYKRTNLRYTYTIYVLNTGKHFAPLSKKVNSGKKKKKIQFRSKPDLANASRRHSRK